MQEIARSASAMGYESMVLADRNNLYGLDAFLTETRMLGLRPVIGVNLVWGAESAQGSALLLARGRAGYEALCRTITRRMLYGAGFSFEESLRDYAGRIHLVASSIPVLEAAAHSVGPGFVWAGLSRPGTALSDQRRLYRAARKLGCGIAAVSKAAFHHPSRHDLHVTLAASGARALRTAAGAFETAGPESWLRSPGEMAALFADVPEALASVSAISDDCPADVPSGRPIFPDVADEGGETPSAKLRRLCMEGLRMRYGSCDGVSRARLDMEIDVITRLGFAPYFLIVAEIVGYARSRSVPVVGRGSGASSIVAYVLGVTNVDPIRYKLCFERFLHEKRKDLPDLDVDLCWLSRDDVIDFAYRRFGRGRVAMISTHNCLRPRSAFRESARAFGIPPAEVNRLSRLIPHHGASLREALGSPRCAAIPRGEEPYRSVIEHACAMEGFPRHLGVHPGGVVIGDAALDRYVPLEEASKGIVVTQFEMRAIEKIGLVKFDLLGNRALTTIRHAVQAASDFGFPVRDVGAIPQSDGKAAGLIERGETLGCFQIESPAMRNLLKQLKVSDCDGVIDALSLVRPGPSSAGMKERYVLRRQGIEETRQIHPLLAPVLGSRYGIFLYEEDVIAAAAAIGGMSLAEGDLLRRSIKKGGGAGEARSGFIAAAARNGVSGESASEVWEHMARFAAYSFCRAHAAGYGVLAFQSAFLKAHCPAAFYFSLMNNHAGMYPKRVHLEEARRMGVRILPPCANRSMRGFAIEPNPSDPPGAAFAKGPLRVGLSRVKGLRESVLSGIIVERKRKPFESLADFMSRVPISAPEAEALILAGSFGFTGLTKPDLFLNLRLIERRAGKADGSCGLFEGAAPADERGGLPEFQAWETARQEYEILGLFISAHPVAVIRPMLAGCTQAAAAAGLAGRRSRICGVVSAGRSARTKKSETMQFLTLEDETGLIECTLFPSVLNMLRGKIGGIGPYIAEGRIEDSHGAVGMNITSIEKAPVPGEPLDVR